MGFVVSRTGSLNSLRTATHQASQPVPGSKMQSDGHALRPSRRSGLRLSCFSSHRRQPVLTLRNIRAITVKRFFRDVQPQPGTRRESVRRCSLRTFSWPIVRRCEFEDSDCRVTPGLTFAAHLTPHVPKSKTSRDSGKSALHADDRLHVVEIASRKHGPSPRRKRAERRLLPFSLVADTAEGRAIFSTNESLAERENVYRHTPSNRDATARGVAVGLEISKS